MLTMTRHVITNTASLVETLTMCVLLYRLVPETLPATGATTGSAQTASDC